MILWKKKPLKLLQQFIVIQVQEDNMKNKQK